MFENLISALKAEKRTIVFTEGEDARILEAASRLKKDGLMDSILVGNVDEVKAAAAKGGFDIEGMEIIDPATYSEMDAMVEKMVELRKGKMSAEDCKAALAKGNYFGTMLVKMGKADALLGGATYSTADTVRPALQLIKTKPGAHLVSSCFILVREKDGVEEKLAMGDCAINIDPTEDEIVESTVETAHTAEIFGIEPRVAMLSYSTGTSGAGSDVEKVREATRLAQEKRPDLMIDGPLQYDAAVMADVAKSKAPNSPVAGRATVFIFPDLNTGNTTYKAVQRSADLISIGPMLQGMRKPVNDLSRGALVDDIVYTIALTAIQSAQQQ